MTFTSTDLNRNSLSQRQVHEPFYNNTIFIFPVNAGTTKCKKSYVRSFFVKETVPYLRAQRPPFYSQKFDLKLLNIFGENPCAVCVLLLSLLSLFT